MVYDRHGLAQKCILDFLKLKFDKKVIFYNIFYSDEIHILVEESLIYMWNH